MTDVEKKVRTTERRCARCRTTTSHVLVPSKAGADWRCLTCGTTSDGYTHAQMLDIMAEAIYGAAPAFSETALPDLENVEVYIAGPNDTEVRLGHDCLVQHVQITGKLPAAGEPLYARAAKVNHPRAAIPYGKVIRVTGNQT